jgi:lipopolysaccharide/colanic/teichoic acid biosynthesis glycosyltransferase
MKLQSRLETLALVAGDLVAFVLALWLALLARFGEVPAAGLFWRHVEVFAAIFLLSILLFFIYDLYRRQTLVFVGALPLVVIRAQLLGGIVAMAAFYFLPYFNRVGLTPKTNLLIYLVFSTLLVIAWRRYLLDLVIRRRRERLLFRCRGAEVEELKRAIEATPRYHLEMVSEKPSIVVFDKYEVDSPEGLAESYRLLFRGVQFVSVQDLYEEVFGRVPLGLVNERWFLEQVSSRPRAAYDFLKRLMDIILGGALAILSLLFYPLIIVAIKLEDGGPIFFYDWRVGRHGRPFAIAKFRTMTTAPDLADRRVTRVGRVLRRGRLDEVPQLWSVVRGRQSLVGPRPERREYVDLYRTRIPFYDARHLLAPGLSGWAQIYHDNHPHFQLAEDATREKLAYDLYYVKHRGLWLDVAIGLKTIKTLLSRSGI